MPEGSRVCSFCSEPDSIRSPLIVSNGLLFCLQCWDNNPLPFLERKKEDSSLLKKCVHCGDSIVDKPQGGGFCERCINNLFLFNYSFKPESIKFFSKEEELDFSPSSIPLDSTMLYGIELEVECVKNRTLDTLVNAIISFPQKVVYCKRDSSIKYGFEIVSHPGSFKWWKENIESIEKILSIRSAGFRSFNTDTCGIHIHMDKFLFSPSDIQKMHDFFRYNPGFILMVSQRVKNKLDRWAGIYHPGDAKVYYKCINKSGSVERHVAINLNPPKTVEIRIFRGTLNTKSFYKNIEFCDALYLFIKEVSMRECTLENFLKFVIFNKEKYENLFEFLKNRSMFVGDGI